MESSSYLAVLQRRWRLVLACLVVGLAAGLLLTPSDPKGAGHGWSSSVRLTTAPGTPKDFSLTLVQIMATGNGEVAKIAAEKTKDDPALLAGQVEVGANNDMGLLTVTAKGGSQAQSEARAKAWAEATVKGFAETQRKANQSTADTMKPQLEQLGKEISDLEAQIQSSSKKNTSLQTQLEAKTGVYKPLLGQFNTLSNQLNDPGVQVLEAPQSTPDAKGSVLAPSSRPLRLALAGALGLALGLVAALMLDRMDTRLRSRQQVEEAFGFPVLAEIPPAPGRQRKGHAVLVAARPDSPVAEAYRTLRSALMLSGPPGLAYRMDNSRLGGVDRSANGSRRNSVPAQRGVDNPAPVVLVMSARRQDGRTSTVTNLAAALAEAGRKVLVLDCDFRNPQADLYLDAKAGAGMSDLLTAERPMNLEDVIRSTPIPNVRMVTAGTATSYPAALLLHIGEVVAQARHHADIVLLDSAPLLFANDTNDLVQYADALLVVTRSGTLSPDQAGRVADLISRTGVPVAGIALVGATTDTIGGGGGGNGSSSFRWSPATRPAHTSVDSPAEERPSLPRGGIVDPDDFAEPPALTARSTPSWAKDDDDEKDTRSLETLRGPFDDGPFGDGQDASLRGGRPPRDQ